MAIAAGPSTPGAVSPSRVRFAVACDTYQAVTLKPAAAARKRRPGSLDHRPALENGARRLDGHRRAAGLALPACGRRRRLADRSRRTGRNAGTVAHHAPP